MAIRDRKEELWDPRERRRALMSIREMFNDEQFQGMVMSALPAGRAAQAERLAASAFQKIPVSRIFDEAGNLVRSSKWDRTIWPTVGRGMEKAGSWVAGKARTIPGYVSHKAKVAGGLAAEPFVAAYRAVVPGERVVAESLWKTKVVPRLAAHKKGLAFSSALAGIIGAGTAIYKMTGDSDIKAGTATVSEGQKKVNEAWDLATNDTLRASVSDSAALKTYVRGIQAAMRNEIRWDPSRTEEAELRARAAIDAVSGTPLWDQTEQASADEYVVRANDVNNYDAEYKARFTDKASRLLGEDFGFKGVLK